MRAVIQRVKEASVAVEGETVGRIGHGLLVLLGVGHGDTADTARLLAEKTAVLRIFDDGDQNSFQNDASRCAARPRQPSLHCETNSKKTNLSLIDVGGSALVVSQFTLYADTRKGRRPSFTGAADPRLADELVETYRKALESSGVPTASGRFGAHMEVSLINDGPFTLMLDCSPSDEGAR